MREFTKAEGVVRVPQVHWKLSPGVAVDVAWATMVRSASGQLILFSIISQRLVYERMMS